MIAGEKNAPRPMGTQKAMPVTLLPKARPPQMAATHHESCAVVDVGEVARAPAIAATITDPSAFRTGRDLAAWIGLVPRQNSSGGKERLGGISKQGDRYLRKLLVVGASAVLRHARCHPDKHPWLIQLLARRPAKVAVVALANKMARIAWAVLARGETYRAPAFAVSEAKGSAMGA